MIVAASTDAAGNEGQAATPTVSVNTVLQILQ